MTKLCGLIPAAGIGNRMQSDLPKQYLNLAGRAVIEHSIAALDALTDLSYLVVALHENDEHFQSLGITTRTSLQTVIGGESRAASVLSGLHEILNCHGTDVWVLVHDAARPLVKTTDVIRLLETVVSTDAVGGLLAMPSTDTLKKINGEGCVCETIDRGNIWSAHTPQLFKSGQLAQAIESALTAGESITDEASAMEIAGFHPVAVESSRDNIKVTTPVDLALCEYLLSEQALSGTGNCDR